MCRGLHDRLEASHKRLMRGRVYCPCCGKEKMVNPAAALRAGWPECCGMTMTIAAPGERVQ